MEKAIRTELQNLAEFKIDGLSSLIKQGIVVSAITDSKLDRLTKL